GLKITGFDISEHGLDNAHPDVKDKLFKYRAQDVYPFGDKHFDLVISLGCFHNLRIFELKTALGEVQRVGKQGYVMLESYRNEIEAAKGPDKFLPHLLGHEGCATVLEAGEGVRTVKKGDKVVMHWRPSDGIQSPTPTYRWNGKTVNAGWVTTFNDHAIVSENR